MFILIMTTIHLIWLVSPATGRLQRSTINKVRIAFMTNLDLWHLWKDRKFHLLVLRVAFVCQLYYTWPAAAATCVSLRIILISHFVDNLARLIWISEQKERHCLRLGDYDPVFTTRREKGWEPLHQRAVPCYQCRELWSGNAPEQNLINSWIAPLLDHIININGGDGWGLNSNPDSRFNINCLLFTL